MMSMDKLLLPMPVQLLWSKGGRSMNKGNKKGFNRNNQFRNRHNRGKKQEHIAEAYAPYNFVPFPEQVIFRYNHPSELPSHCGKDSKTGELLSGEITFDIVAHTPILVADGSDENKSNSRQFVKNVNGEYEIPGSTLRGLIRQTASVLSMSNWARRIDDETFFYRDVAGKTKRRDEYMDALGIMGNEQVPLNVKAGYIVKEQDGYVIYPAKERGENHMTYYKCHQSDFPELEEDILEKDIKEGFKIKDVKFSVDSKDRVIRLNEENASYKGKLLFTGPMPRKKIAYIVNEMDTDNPETIKLSPADIKLYQADYNFRCSKFGTDERKKEFYKLPEEIGIKHAKPCFYIYVNSRLYIGFTPFVRIQYKYSTKDAIPKYLQYESIAIDYEQALFGFTNLGDTKKDNGDDTTKFNYASRLSFLHALIADKPQPAIVRESLILGQPRASAIGMYLEQPDEQKVTCTYNKEDAKLRGLKQYWLKRPQKNRQIKSDNENVVNDLELLPEGTKFVAKIRFDQLHADELGLLLWAIQAPAYHQIGMAKPYGYGIVRFEHLKLHVFDREKAYDLTNFFAKDMKEESIDEYIHHYKSYVRERFEIDIEEQESIRTFLSMKEMSPLPREKMQYMDVNLYSKTPVLPSAKTLLTKYRDKEGW